MKNLLLVYGGGGTEHEVSVRSAQFFKEKIDHSLFNTIDVEITKDGKWIYKEESCVLNLDKTLKTHKEDFKLDLAIYCVHGTPGETGHLPALFELIDLPYLGCNQETSVFCFNKLSTKQWLETCGLKTTPFLCVSSLEDLEKAKVFYNEHQDVFVKASNQGSSVGCYRCQTQDELINAIQEAFKLSPYVLVEKTISGREFEISTFEYNKEIHITHPCEILSPESDFYTYEEKYSNQSETHIELKANLDENLLKQMKEQARLAYDILKIRHLSRMDFFVTSDNEVFLNEVNTMPGHTSISMFPSMMEDYGVKYSDFLRQHLVELSK